MRDFDASACCVDSDCSADDGIVLVPAPPRDIPENCPINGKMTEWETKLIVPREWMEIDFNGRIALSELLSWESLSKWDFDVFEFNKLLCQSATNRPVKPAEQHFESSVHDFPKILPDKIKYGSSRCSPLLILGWAVLASPHSQIAMQQSFLLNQTFKDEAFTTQQLNPPSIYNSTNFPGYDFSGKLNIALPKIIQTLRCIEFHYNDVPYHNNIHVTDVLQTLHSILVHLPMQTEQSTNKQSMNTQQMGENTNQGSSKNLDTNMCPTSPFLSNVTSLDLYSILLSAIIHDISHEGLNNFYYANQPSSFDSLIANKQRESTANYEFDKDPNLEQFHDSFGRQLLQEHGAFEGLTAEEKTLAKEVISMAVIETDISKHFHILNKLQENIVVFEERDKITTNDAPHECASTNYNTTSFFSFLLHAADISSPAKPYALSSQWIPRVFSEFFFQGDLEEKQGLPISPLCNRADMTTPTNFNLAQSQVQFIKIFIDPTFRLLGRVVPWIVGEVIPFVENNLNVMQRWGSNEEVR